MQEKRAGEESRRREQEKLGLRGGRKAGPLGSGLGLGRVRVKIRAQVSVRSRFASLPSVARVKW